MNRPKTTSLLALLLMLGTALTASAYDFIYDNLRFTILDANAKTVEVAQMNPVTTRGVWEIDANPVYNGVTYTTVAVGDSAFYNCTGMTSITIPNTVTRIGTSAFRYCTGLTQFTIPSSVTNLGHYSLSYCRRLKNVAVPNSVTTMGNGVFYDCDSLNTVTWSNQLTTIPTYTFYECMQLSNFDMPHWITSIGYCAFYETNLQQIIVPYGVTDIGDYAFAQSRQLTTVLIPSSVTMIGFRALDYCPSLTDIYCNMSNPPSMQFLDVPATCMAYVPVGMVDLYKPYGWDHFNQVVDGAFDFNYGPGFSATTPYHMTITSAEPVTYNGTTYAGTAKYVYHPNIETSSATIFTTDNYETDNMCGSGKRYLMTEIGHYCLENSQFLNVTVAGSIKSIETNAFARCRSLKNVTLPEGLEYIGWQAFIECRALTSIAIPNTVTNIGEAAFAYCSNLDSVQWPTGMDNIPNHCFYYCGLKKYKMPHWIKSIGESAFGWSGLTGNVILPYGLETIGNSAYYATEHVKTVLIPSSVTQLGNETFRYCDSLTTIYCNMAVPPAMNFERVPSTCMAYVPVGKVQQYHETTGWNGLIVEAGAYDFNYGSAYSPTAIYHMTITSDEPIEYNGETYAGTAKYVFHPNIEATTSSAFYPAFYETNVMSGGGKNYLITEIGDSCFRLSSATITNIDFTSCGKLTKLGHDAFWGSKLQQLTLPASVTTYDAWALYYMPNLAHLYVDNPTPVTISSNTFYYADQNRATLHVPTQAAVTAYKAAPVWKNFFSIDTEDPMVYYDITISGVPVTNANCANITGEGISGSVTYDPSSKTLTLNNAVLDYPNNQCVIINAEGVTLDIVGTDNVIGSPESIVYTGILSFYPLSITGDGYNLSKISVYSSSAGLNCCDGNNTISDVSLFLNSTECAAIQGPASDMYNTSGNIDVVSSHLELNPGPGSGYYPISYLRHLTLDGCFIATPQGGYWDSEHSGIVDAQGDLVIGEPAVIDVDVNYGVSICGIPVTNQNYRSITGPGISGNVSYNPYNNLVYLNGAHLTPPEYNAPAIYFYNGRDAYVYFNGHDNQIGTRNDSIKYGIFCEGGRLNVEGATADYSQNSLRIYSSYAPVVHMSDDNGNDPTVVTTLADGSLYLYSSKVVYYARRADNSTLQINGCHVETTSAGGYYPFNALDELYLDNCYFAEPAGGWWYFDVNDNYGFGILATAEGYIHSGPIVIEYGEEPAGMRGDVNGDGEITPADISALINYLLGGNVWPAAIKAPANGKTLSAVQPITLIEAPVLDIRPVKTEAAEKMESKASKLPEAVGTPQPMSERPAHPATDDEAPFKASPDEGLLTPVVPTPGDIKPARDI